MRIHRMALFSLILACTTTSAFLFIPGCNPTALVNAIAFENLQRQKRAVFDASRQANSPATKPMLQKALDQNILSASEYYGELGHMLSVDVDNPGEILLEILESKDQYGYEVALSAMASSPSWMETLAPHELQYFAQMLQSNQPELAGHVHELGLSSVFTFENWLRSMMNVQPNLQARLDLLSQLIEQGSTDPRQAIAIEYAMGDSELLRLVKPSVRDKLKQDLAQYLANYPDNQVARYIVIERNEP